MNIEVKQLIGKRVLVLPDTIIDKTKSGIFIPDNSQQRPNTGIVIAIGSTIEDIKVGDTVSFGKHSGTEISIKGKIHILMEYNNCFGILNK